MTELHEYYMNKGYRAMTDKVHDLSDSLLIAELDDTIQFDIVKMDTCDWAKEKNNKVYMAIAREMYKRMSSRAERLEEVQQDEKMKRKARSKAFIEVAKITDGLDLDGLIDKYASLDYDLKHAEDEERIEFLRTMLRDIEERITIILLKEHGYTRQEDEQDCYVWMKK